MYYYGNTGYYGGGYGAQSTCGAPTYAGYTSGYGIGAAIWIVWNQDGSVWRGRLNKLGFKQQ